MSEIVVVPPHGGEKLQLGPIDIEIVEGGGDTEHRLGVLLIRVPPHTDGPPRHWHARHDEGFYVVSGRARFTTDTDEVDAPAGTFVMVPVGSRHTFSNPTDQECVILNTLSPDLYVQYFRDVAAVGTGPVPAGQMLEIMERYSTYPAEP